MDHTMIHTQTCSSEFNCNTGFVYLDEKGVTEFYNEEIVERYYYLDNYKI